jgi:hypothetical protein
MGDLCCAGEAGPLAAPVYARVASAAAVQLQQPALGPFNLKEVVWQLAPCRGHPSRLTAVIPADRVEDLAASPPSARSRATT